MSLFHWAIIKELSTFRITNCQELIFFTSICITCFLRRGEGRNEALPLGYPWMVKSWAFQELCEWIAKNGYCFDKLVYSVLIYLIFWEDGWSICHKSIHEFLKFRHFRATTTNIKHSLYIILLNSLLVI